MSVSIEDAVHSHPGGQVRPEWNRCPGSMAGVLRESVAPLRRSSVGFMPARIGRLSADVGPVE